MVRPSAWAPLSRVKSGLFTSVRAGRRAALRIKAYGRVSTGEEFVVGPRCRIARGVSIQVGDRVNIATDFACQVNLVAGDDIMISSRVAFIGDDHPFHDPARTVQQHKPSPMSLVTLEGDNLIGFGSIIIGPVTIGRGVIVGAGSLVTTDLPPYTVCVGRPAKPIRNRHEDK